MQCTESFQADDELRPGGTEISAEELAGSCSQLIFSWVAPFLRVAVNAARDGSLSLQSLPIAPALERPELAIEGLAAHIAQQQRQIGKQSRTPSLLRAILCWQRHVLIREVLRAVLCSLLFVLSPLLLRLVVSTMRSTATTAQGCLAVVGMAAFGLGGGVLQQHSFHNFTHLGRQIWAGLVGNMFDKLACLDRTTFGAPSEGQILSMIGQDASIFPYMSPFFCIFLVMPCNILFPAIFLFYFLREAFAVGFAVCILIALVSNWASVQYKRLVTQKLQVADARLVLLNETLQGIRSVKLCAWEQALEARVASARREETRLLFWVHMCYALQQGVTAALPVFGITATFLTHAALGRPLEADIVAMSIAYFDQLSLGFLLLPNAKMQLEMMRVGITRVGRLLMHPEANNPRVEASASERPGIQIKDASFAWPSAAGGVDVSTGSEAQLALRDVTLSVNPGDLVVVVGPVASGKSTLASGVFGFAHASRGHVKLVGKAAYVPQSPQILNNSVRENVLFGSQFHEERYRTALRACCLEQDLAQFSEGDSTEIGEKGITISGGQRARVALARAYYSGADVVVLDDPLSAMDAHVGAGVFQQCILALRNQGKAVLLMTNQLSLCSYADTVVMLEAGIVVAQRGFAELAATPGSQFASLLFSQSSPIESEELGEGGETAARVEEPRKQQKLTPQGADGSESPARKQTRASGMKVEEVMQGRVGLWEWQKIARSGRSTLLSCLLLGSCIAVPACMYLSTVMLGVWTSAARDVDTAFAATREVALYVSAGVLFAVCCAVRVSAAALYFLRVSRQLHSRMLASTLRQSMAWYDTTPLGRVLNRFSQDVALTDLQMPRLFEFTMQHASVVIVGLLGAGAVAWPTLIVIVPLGFPLWRLHQSYGAVAVHLQRIMLSATSPVMSQASSFLIALDTIRAFGREKLFAARFRTAMADYVRTYYWIHATDRLAMTVLTVFCVPLLTLFLGMAVILLVRTGMLSPDLGGLALSMSNALAQRIPLFLWCASTLEKFFGGAQRMAEYADLPWEGGEVDHAAWISASARKDDRSPDVLSAPALKLDNVHLRYQPDLPFVLCGLSLDVQPGERLGVCGRTGSGKSTLFLACFRMVEVDRGVILVFGRDASTLPLPVLRSQLAIVPQDPLMFSGTVRSNLDFHGRHTDQEVWEALKLASLETHIGNLPSGLQEPVQEKGSNFSGGTVQLLCIARILLARQRIVFLDECTASVDLQTDATVQAAVKSAFDGCAVICIAHRLRTIIDYDRIACLDKGCVAEVGSPHDLLQNDGLFSQLVSSAGEGDAKEMRQIAASQALVWSL
eukprot:TRINITY_DN102505_c0_g1_i1.p1 TRINITY_DN102505_c0_g1~~TRINITY_DN102505_c0_g1_i1.p1  ORF type:complete len:1318 (-),score=217.82 TRINITY_DN102505_c0_g1_i1:201-4154(-)